MNKIEINLSDDLFSNSKRKLKHKQLIISDNLEMFQQAEVIFLSPDGSQTMQEFINANEQLSTSQKQIVLERFKSKTYASNTQGSFVDPQTGAEVLPTENGFPEGVEIISELSFWQSLPSAFFSGANLSAIAPNYEWKAGNTLAELVYNGIQFSMLKMAERNRV